MPLLAKQVPALGDLKWIATDTLPLEAASEWREPDVGPDTLAYLQYTSGSTAAAKGVMVPHRVVMANLAQLAACYRIGSEGAGFMWLPTFHNFGLVAGFLQPISTRTSR